MATTLTLEELNGPVEAELAEVRSATELLWREALDLVHEPAHSHANGRGKLVRPALCLLAAGAAGGGRLDGFVRLATAIELVHLGALIHDDVVDGSPLRRGEASLNSLWNDRTAVLGGDYLVAPALAMMAEYHSCALLMDVAECMREMAAGELADFGRGIAHRTQDDCIALASRKTASLFAVACSTPTRLLDGRGRGPLHRYGSRFGVAFQLIDDVLDLCQDERTLGKPACSDLVEGKITLPVFFMRQAMNPDELLRLDGMKGASLSDEDRAWVGAMLSSTGARARVEAVAAAYAVEARAALGEVAPSAFRDSMAGLTDFVLIRGS
ncbi:MAG TPA: polyprenyl synthetase family protein [Candidatus Hydrogenedentes bacterium]|nr:polyprenyl synthetase family protein [Candidatus Hydrogenedentota bacterium]